MAGVAPAALDSQGNLVASAHAPVAETEADIIAKMSTKEKIPPGMFSLVKKLAMRLEDTWRATGNLEHVKWSDAIYNTAVHIKRRPPNEIEAVLATMDRSAMSIIEQKIGSRMPSLQEFAEAVVRTGTYDADAVLGFIGGVVDLFLEVLWSQQDKAYGAKEGTVRWGQLMNHFIESPEIAMFEGSEMSAGLGGKTRGSVERMPQMDKSDIVDCAKHLGSYIEKMYWIQHLDSLVTCEGTESVYFWNPMESVDAPRCIQTPQLKDVPDCFDENDRPLYTVLAVAWDGSQDLTALLSNRLLIVWRLRSRDKFQFRQRVIYRINATKTNESRQSKSEPPWKVSIKPIDPKTESMNLKSSSSASGAKRGDGGRGSVAAKKDTPNATDSLEREEKQMRLQMREERNAKDVANQLDIWFNTQRKLYVTTDKNGRLCFWDLLSIENTPEPGPFEPLHSHGAHKRVVTAYVELGHRKFCSASLDRTVVLWDTLNLTPEMRIEDHTASVLDLAYLNSFYSLISVGCEKRVYVWSIDSTAYRGLTAKLSGHQANLIKVSAGNDQRGRAFFTLDEACIVIVWDVATLSSLQTINTSKQNPRHALCYSNLGRFCLAGRRFYFYEGNELMALSYMGATPSKEQLAKTKKPVAGSFKERAKPRCCSLNEMRGTMISVTESEVRVHGRGDPSHSRVVFCLIEGEVITSYATMDSLHLAVLGTSKGAVHFIKCRSGCAMKVYEGRLEGDAWEPGAAGPQGGGGGPQMITADEQAEASKARAGAGGASQRGVSGGQSPGGQSRHSLGSASSSCGGSAAAGDGSPQAVSAKKGMQGMLGVQTGASGRAMQTTVDMHSTCGPESSAGNESAEHQGEEEELAHEFQEIKGLVGMGYAEQDARRALHVSRRKLADAWREWQQDEALQQLYEKADAEGQAKALEEVRQNNINSNVENAVEKLLSGAVATTVTEDQVIVRPPLRAADGAKEGEELTRPRRLSASHNAPTAEEIARGLSRKIQCVLACEEQQRVYVGTDEGQVLVHCCDPNFTIKRWLTQPSPNVSAVTCLDVVYENRGDGPWGLLLVGTQEGSVHLYGLPNLRLAGSINIGRVLPDVNPESGDLQLRHARLLWMPAGSPISNQFPLAVLTIDRRSRFRFWGIRLHSQSGKLEELALLLDGGQLAELVEEVVNPYYVEPEESDDVEVAAENKKKKDKKEAKKKEAEGEQFRPPARISCVCTVKGQVVLPLKAVPGALPPGQAAVDANEKEPQNMSAAFLALAAAFASSGGEGSGGEGEGGENEASKKLKFEDTRGDSSATEEDEAETAEGRQLRDSRRPTTPINALDADKRPKPPLVATAEGSNYIFFGDAVGRIWCMDAIGSAIKAHEERPPLTVLLDEKDSQQGASKARGGRSSIRFNTGMGSNGSTGNRGSQADVAAIGKQGIPTQYAGVSPETLKIATSWQAHEHFIVSLVSTSSPPALVSTDSEKHVKVWSTSGELWGHFQLSGVDPGNTFLWPPPHVIAAQNALMTVAKGLCKKLGLRTSGVAQDSNLAAQIKGDRNAKREKRKAEKRAAKDATSSGSEKKSKDRKRTERKVVVVGDENDALEATRNPSRGPSKGSDTDDAPPQFMTELPAGSGYPKSSRTSSKTKTEARDSAKKPVTPPAATKAALVDGEAGAADDGLEREISQATIRDGDGNDAGGAGDDEAERKAPKSKGRVFSRDQMNKMVRNRGFSSGFQSYSTFMNKSASQGALEGGGKRSGPNTDWSQLESNRSNFFEREASDFGLSRGTRKETDQWERSCRGMGVRSSSEGALYRFAQAAVNDATRSVYDDLGVDVSKTDMSLLKRPSFLARLDRRPEVEEAFLRDPSSSTAQAVAKMYGGDSAKGNSRLSIKKSSALASSGKSVVKK